MTKCIIWTAYLSYPAWVAITKYHRLGDRNNWNLFLKVLETKSPNSASRVCGWWDLCLWVSANSPLCFHVAFPNYVHTERRQASSGVSSPSNKGTNPTGSTPPSGPYLHQIISPNLHSLNTITFGFRGSTSTKRCYVCWNIEILKHMCALWTKPWRCYVVFKITGGSERG